jgi:HK97 family phage major capsid protein
VLVMGEDSLMSRADAIPTDSMTVTVPTDETTAWGTTGVRAYWGAEAGAMTQSKPALKDHTTRLHKLHALVPLSDELVEDAPMSSALITRKAGEALQFKVNDAIVNGTGVGQPLGILNAPSLVTVAAEGSQTAGTVHAKNIAKMWARMPASARGRAVWLANQDVESALMELGFQVGSPSGTMTGGMPLFIPPGGLSALPYATLLGKPVITTEACAAIGTVGDIILAYLPGYFAPFKSGGVRSSVSMHLWFDQDLVAFKWTLRIGGQPWLQAAISRKSGSNTLSHFVALAAR